MKVTTSLRYTEELIVRAKRIANEYNATFFFREHQSLASIERNEDLLVVEKERLIAFPKGKSEPVFFHPNSAMFRMKRVARGERDPLIEAAKLEKGMSFLDCTLGLGSDSFVASVVVTETGTVTGVEENQLIAMLVREGIDLWTKNPMVTTAMKRVNVIHMSNERYLASLPTNSFDVVYFDPMFDEHIDSDGIAPLKQIAARRTLSIQTIEEAKRVARNRVVLKDHYLSKRFANLNFHVMKRPTAKFHFGFIEV